MENNRIIILMLSAQGLRSAFFDWPVILTLVFQSPEGSSTNQVTWSFIWVTTCQDSTHFKRIQTSDVVTMARIVPTGMDFCASLRSPDLFEPAMIPENTFGHKIKGEKKPQRPRMPSCPFCPRVLTSHWRKEDANQYHEWSSYIWKHIQMKVVLLACYIHRRVMCFLQYLSFLQIIAP